eukprot:gene12934-27289_t
MQYLKGNLIYLDPINKSFSYKTNGSYSLRHLVPQKYPIFYVESNYSKLMNRGINMTSNSWALQGTSCRKRTRSEDLSTVLSFSLKRFNVEAEYVNHKIRDNWGISGALDMPLTTSCVQKKNIYDHFGSQKDMMIFPSKMDCEEPIDIRPRCRCCQMLFSESSVTTVVTCAFCEKTS